MVERVNGTIKTNTKLKYEYPNRVALEKELSDFLIFYNLHRRHVSLKNELNVKTPFDALEKWFTLKPELFIISPALFKINLHSHVIYFHQQPSEN